METFVDDKIYNPITGALPQQNYIMTGVVNGLIASATIWVFWTPFLIGVVVPISSAIIKNAICNFSSTFPKNIKQFMQGSPESADQLIEKDTHVITELNQFNYASFVILSVVVILNSLFFANYIINKYNLDRSSIIILNVIMFFVITIIEAVFFAGVATQYVPWEVKSIFTYISNYMKSFPNDY